MSRVISRGDVVRLAAQEATFRSRVANLTCTSADDGRRLAQFAYRCVAETPLDSGQTPLAMLTGQPVIQDGVRLVGQWLAGETISVAQIKEAWTSARREADTLAKDMVGATAAQWAAIAAIEAAESALAAEKTAFARTVQAVAFAALYSRAAGIRPSPEALHFQSNLADALLPA